MKEWRVNCFDDPSPVPETRQANYLSVYWASSCLYMELEVLSYKMYDCFDLVDCFRFFWSGVIHRDILQQTIVHCNAYQAHSGLGIQSPSNDVDTHSG